MAEALPGAPDRVEEVSRIAAVQQAAFRMANQVYRLSEPRAARGGDDHGEYTELQRFDDCPTAPHALGAYLIQPAVHGPILSNHGQIEEDLRITLTIVALRDGQLGEQAPGNLVDLDRCVPVCHYGDRGKFPINVATIARHRAQFIVDAELA